MNKPLLACLLATFALSLPSTQAAETTDAPVTNPAVIKLGSGFDYSRGRYGFTQVTEVFSVPLNLSYDQDRWTFRASIPYITIKGPASVIAGEVPMAAPGRPLTKYQNGLGDPVFSATFHAHPVAGEWNVDLTERAKLGTADTAKGLGTGENDYYTQIDFYRTYGSFTPFGTVGYRVLGSNAMFPLKDGLYASLGGSYRVGSGTIVGGAFDWRSKIIESAQDGTDGLVFVSTDLNARWNLLGYALVGFNSASPDVGFGGSATFKF
jgi:hypothetical protein